MMNESSFAGPRAFARHMLLGERLRIAPLTTGESMHWGAGFMEAILFRDACWQVSLIVIFPNVVIPPHKHMRVASVDIGLTGTGSSSVVPSFIDRVLTPPEPEHFDAYLQRVPAGSVHYGCAGASGATFLSFQQWIGEPGFVAEDWEEA